MAFRSLTRARFLIVFMVGFSEALTAQAAKPTFEVASVKRNLSGFGIPGPRPGGVYSATGSTLQTIVLWAYGIRDYQLLEGPGWVRTDRFDIAARAGRDASGDELRLMVQSLLEDRFKLVLRQEQRELRVYALVPARRDGRLGPSLRKAAADCGTAAGRGETLEETRTPNGGVTQRRTCTPIATLVSTVSSSVGAPVTDSTELVGMWDYELSFTGERRAGASAAAVAADPNDAPALFTVLQEQLGLKLEATRGRVDVLVIDSVQQPTEN